MRQFRKRVFMITTIVLCFYSCINVILHVGERFGYYPLIVQSGSMEPEIPTGSLIFANTRYNEVTTGDVVAFFVGDKNEQLVTHRIVSRTKTGFITKGDANIENDIVELQKDRIFGEIVVVIPKIGYVLEKLNQRRRNEYIAIFLVCIWLLIMITNQIWK